MKFFKNQTWLLILITVIAFALRTWHLNELPAQLNRDEAAIGLNAQLLATTGKDEWGRPWPIALESFGDYKLPGYVWLTVIAGKLFGWHDWVVRLPSALAGTFLPLLVFLWLKKLGKTDRQGLWTAFLLAVLPVNWFYSRMAFEANVALDLLIGWLILISEKKLQSINVWVDLGLVSVTVAMILTYNTPLLLLPFLLLYLPFFWKFQNWKNWIGSWSAISVIAVAGFYALSQLFGQKSGITLFTDPTVWTLFVEGRGHLTGLSKLVESNWYGYLAIQMLDRFLASWSPHFLVTHGGTHPWHTLPGAGHLLWSQYVLALIGFVIGLIQLIKTDLTAFLKRAKLSEFFNAVAQENSWLVFLTLMSLIPAIITTDAPHATRSLIFFVLLVMWAGEAVVWLLTQSKAYKTVVGSLLLLLVLAQASLYGYTYFVRYPEHQAVFQPGLPQTIKLLETSYPDPQETIAVVGDGYAYSIWAWYLQLPPERFFTTIVKQLPDRIGFRYGERLDRYHFIMQSADRSPSEKILVEWKDNNWQIKTF